MVVFPKGKYETEGRVPGNLHYDLPVTFKGGKGGKKERQAKGHEDQDPPIRTLQEQPTKILLSAHPISIESGKKPQMMSLLWHPLLGPPPPTLGAQFFHFTLFYLNKLSSLSMKFILQLCGTRTLVSNF
jgi:hypothetical protein